MPSVSSPTAGFVALFPRELTTGNSAPVDTPPLDSFGPAAGVSEIASLLASIAQGDREAFAVLYQRTSRKMFGIAKRILRDDGAAEDVLQEVYITIWAKAGSYEAGRSSPITWLAVITRNRAVDRRRRVVPTRSPIEAAANVPDMAPAADRVIEEAQRSGQLYDCLDTLDERGRRYIRAAFLDGATYSELATRDGIPLGTMKSWIRRGLQSLKGCLEA